MGQKIRAALLFALAAGIGAMMPAARAEERVVGTVREIVVTHCDALQRGGCAGTLTLESAPRAGRLVVEVVLGTPISRCGEHVTLGSLEGQTVTVTTAKRRGMPVARAIEVARSRDAEPGSRQGC